MNDLTAPETLEYPADPAEFASPHRIASTALTRFLDHDPATLGFPPMLPLEIVLRREPLRAICESYELTREEFERLRTLPAFIAAVKEAMRLVHLDGLGFKAKARLQAEELLKTSWVLIHSSDTPATVKADLIKWTAKVAGHEPAPGQGGGGNAFQINIHMG